MEEETPVIPEVSGSEMTRAIRRMARKNTAPGPDGIPGKAWVLVADALGDSLRCLFTDCLKNGEFPDAWKIARLVLLRKYGQPGSSPSAYCPICLLDEAGKLLERIIAARLAEHLKEVGPDLASCQYGFKEGRSTVDAVLHVRALADESTSQGGG